MKRCIRCNKEIKEKDHYLRVSEFSSGKKQREEYYHKKCFDDRNMVRNMALGLAARANRLMGVAEEKIM